MIELDVASQPFGITRREVNLDRFHRHKMLKPDTLYLRVVTFTDSLHTTHIPITWLWNILKVAMSFRIDASNALTFATFRHHRTTKLTTS